MDQDVERKAALHLQRREVTNRSACSVLRYYQPAYIWIVASVKMTLDDRMPARTGIWCVLTTTVHL